ncbi:MAG: sulfatase-like hydrolase/transferase [Candidatus Aquicultorales bacterium]
MGIRRSSKHIPKKKGLVLHPVFLALFPYLFLYAQNQSQLAFASVLLPIGVTVAITLLVWGLAGFIGDDKHKNALFVSIPLVAYFSYAHVLAVVARATGGGDMTGPLLTAAFAFLAATALFAVWRTGRSLQQPTGFLNAVAVFLVLISLMQIGSYQVRRFLVARSLLPEGMQATVDPSKRPDVYYIILDGYARFDTLEEYYKYEDTSFESFLMKKGFAVTTESRSNYSLTFLSLASSLNMDHITDLTQKVGKESNEELVPNEMIKKNKLMGFLKAQGYAYIHYSSGYQATNYNESADENILVGEKDLVFTTEEFSKSLDKAPVVDSFKIYFNAGPEEARKRMRKTFDALAKVRKTDGPKFVFAHILMPHMPYIFDKNGEAAPTKEEQRRKGIPDSDLYLDQLTYVNKEVTEIIEGILEGSERPPIIVIQGDHGSAFSGSFAKPTPELLKERMRIFNAVYLPDGAKGVLYEGITPVNTFRVLFNAYLGTDFKLLDDSSYFSTYEKPYRFKDVTEVVK